jgi:hypothetical protein
MFFDIETGPLPDDRLAAMLPEFVPPPHPGAFDPAAVKCGNLGAEKAAAKVEEARKAHEAAVSRYAADVTAAKAKHFDSFKDKAALDATTGRVVAIGFTLHDWDDGPEIIDCDLQRDETEVECEFNGLRDFWFEVEAALSGQIPIVGFNTHHFDLPFLVRRSWLLGVPIPMGVRQGRYWNPIFIDLMQVWGFYGQDMVKLDTLAKAFGMQGKVTEGDNGQAVSGADFHKLWRTDRATAEKYLRQDVLLCQRLAERMGVA